MTGDCFLNALETSLDWLQAFTARRSIWFNNCNLLRTSSDTCFATKLRGMDHRRGGHNIEQFGSLHRNNQHRIETKSGLFVFCK